MRALLLAAGLGTRLRPLTETVPKCLVEIDGRPLLDHWLGLLSGAGIRDAIVNLHHLPHLVQAYLGRCSHDIRVKTVFESELLGTAGTLVANRDFVGDEPVMLIHADNLSKFDPRAFVDAYYSRPRGVEITMMTFRTDDPRSCGIVELEAGGIVRKFHEKVDHPPGNLANAAVYILAPTVVETLSRMGRRRLDFSTEVLPLYLGRINTFHNDIYHRDIGTLASLESARREYPVRRLA